MMGSFGGAEGGETPDLLHSELYFGPLLNHIFSGACSYQINPGNLHLFPFSAFCYKAISLYSRHNCVTGRQANTSRTLNHKLVDFNKYAFVCFLLLLVSEFKPKLVQENSSVFSLARAIKSLTTWSGGDLTTLHKLVSINCDDLRRSTAFYFRRDHLNRPFPVSTLFQRAFLRIAKR
jgi:hypothetical protein